MRCWPGGRDELLLVRGWGLVDDSGLSGRSGPSRLADGWRSVRRMAAPALTAHTVHALRETALVEEAFS
jgi:hypothetical protein